VLTPFPDPDISSPSSNFANLSFIISPPDPTKSKHNKEKFIHKEAEYSIIYTIAAQYEFSNPKH
jgi:hypothetical protein